MQGAKDNAVYLVDASVYVFRAWYALPDTLRGADGQPINAIHGFSSFLVQLLRDARPRHIAIAFDESLTSSYRNELYPAYKANRAPAPPELKRQFQGCREMAEAMGIVTFASDRYEADDLIGTLAARARIGGQQAVILSRDKDLAQLIRDDDLLWDFPEGLRLDSAGVEERFGVGPEQMLDFQALTGDSVDNIPGVSGVGPTTAAMLLRKFGDLDTLFKSLDAVAKLPKRGARLRTLLETGRDSAYLARELCRIVCDVPLPPSAGELAWRGADVAKLDETCARIGLGEGLRRRLAALERPP